MKIHYISCHGVLEYDEVSLLTELGFEVFSNGAYLNPKGHLTLPRPAIKGAKYYKDLVTFATEHPRTELPKELIDPFDVIIIMHAPDVLIQNWDRIKHKRVIWRTIGQSTSGTERAIQKMRTEGLQIVRYSPNEGNIQNFAGKDALIRFYKDPKEFKDWTGKDKTVVNFSQSLKGRREFCHYDTVLGAMAGFPGKIYGSGNEDLGKFNGGEVPYTMMKEIMRGARAYVYAGTWPASYTLSFIEAFMTGTPIVAIGKRLAHALQFEQFDFYEVEDIIEDGKDGFICNDVQQLRLRVNSLLEDEKLAKMISTNGRAKAIELFGKTEIAKAWKNFLMLKGGGK